MKLSRGLFAALLLVGSAVSADTARPKPIYKVSKLSMTEVAISCNNGGDPTGRKIGDTLIISCGE